MIDLLDLSEVPQTIHARTGLEITTRRILYMAANGLFPKPVIHAHRRLIKFSRRDVIDWIARTCANSTTPMPRTNARDKVSPARAPRRRS